MIRETLKKLFQVQLLVAIVAWLNAAYSLWHQQKLTVEGLTKPSFCNFGGSFNCDTVALSKFSVFLGIPVSAWGMLFYAVVIILTLIAYFRTQDNKLEEVPAYTSLLLVLNTINLPVTLALAAISFGLIKSVCLMCVLTYLFNFALFGTSLKAASAIKGGYGYFTKAVKVLTPGLVSILLILGAVQLFIPKVIKHSLSGGQDLSDRTVNYFIQDHLNAPQKNIRLEDAPSKGPQNAQLTIVTYSDFQCPFCAREASTTPELLKQYEGKIRYVFKNYPLDSSCNPEMKRSMHPLACLAAKTGRCVYKAKGDDAFFSYKQEVFSYTESNTLNQERIRESATKLGIGAEELKSCVESPATHEAILSEVREANAIGVQGTPAVFINGKFFQMPTVPLIYQRLLEHYLDR